MNSTIGKQTISEKRSKIEFYLTMFLSHFAAFRSFSSDEWMNECANVHWKKERR